MKKKFLAALLSLAIIAAAIPSSIFSISASAREGDSFHTSFEQNEDYSRYAYGALELDADGNGKAYGIMGAKPIITGEYVGYVTEYTGNADYNTSETKGNLFDRNSGTKWLTNAHVPSASNPIWVNMQMKEEIVVRTYVVTAANDAQGRDPKSWRLLGSADGEDWTLLDTQADQEFEDRFANNYYTIDNETAYQYYRFEITENFGNGQMTQFSRLVFGSNVEGEVPDTMEISITGGGSALVGRSAWSGSKALQVAGTHNVDERAYSYNVLYDNLDIAVGENTQLSYLMLPDYQGDYDYDLTSAFMAVDLRFSDGTYLSDTNAVDQYGHGMSAREQGESLTLYTKQWNHMYSNIGDVAAGKTIEAILVVYDNPFEDTYEEAPLPFVAYFDDITIENVEPIKYDHLSDYVNVLRGTNDFPGAFSRGLNGPMVTAPHGFNFWAPSTTNSGTNMYNYYDSTFTHMTITHSASYWTGDRGTFQFMANTSSSDYVSAGSRSAGFNHSNETANAHYYSVKFDEGSRANGVQMELTPTEHAAVVRFTFPEDAANRNVIFDSVNATSNGQFQFAADGKSFTARTAHSSNGMPYMYIYGEFDAAGTGAVNSASGAKANITFPEGTNVVTMKIATSFMNAAQAKKNLDLEVSAEDTFDSVFTRNQQEWDEKLGIIEVEGATYDQMVTLYSNMYRLFAYPNLMSENVGTEENPDWKYGSPYSSVSNPTIKNGRLYYNNGFWDTYRTTWAAYALLTPTKNTDMLNGLAQHYIDQGWVPRWIAPAGTNSMVGTSSDVVFGDALMREQKFDAINGYLSSVRNASVVSNNLTNGGRSGLNTSIFLGYTPTSQGEGMSWAIEGYINDFGIANMAKGLRDAVEDKTSEEYREYNDEYVYFSNRAKNYVNLFNSDLDFFHGKSADGSWRQSAADFDPTEWGNDYTETNAWNMAFSVPQDGQGLANLYGGKEALGAKLDEFFDTKGSFKVGGYNGVIHEMTEAREVKMGQYGHNNQPSHHIPYMYLYAGQPWKTQEKVREIMDRLYAGESIGQGYCGDEDNGEMSAWYILSALGMYPVNMGSGEFAIGSPLFTKATVTMDNGNVLEINAPNNSSENIYVQNVKLNGDDWNQTYFDHTDIAAGGVIDFEMGSAPSAWGTEDEAAPPSLTEGDEVAQTMSDLLSANPIILDSAPTANLVGDSVYISDSVTNPRYLFSNNSGNVAAFTSDTASIYIAFGSMKSIEMYTITSGTNTGAAPKSWTLWGSNDNETWTKLDERSDQEFRWAKYTRPFALDEEANYQNYRLDIDGTANGSAISIAELELLGYPLKSATKDALASTIATAKNIKNTGYAPSTYQDLQDAIAQGQRIYNLEDATPDQILAAIQALNNAMGALAEIRSGVGRIEAESFDKASSGIKDEGSNIGGTAPGGYLGYVGLDFGRKGISSFAVRYSSVASDCQGAYVEIHLDSIDSPAIGTVALPTITTGWGNYFTSELGAITENVTGVHDLYITLHGDNKHVANIDWFEFYEADFDASMLEALIAEAKGLNEENYTAKSWDAMQAALTAAEEALADEDATPAELEAAYNNLEAAVKALEEVTVNKKILKATIDYAQKQDITYLNGLVKAKYIAALNAAIRVDEDINATQAEVNKAAEDLLEMIHMLDYTSDPRQLAELVAYAETLKDNLDQYKANSKQAFLDALENAYDVLADERSLDADYEEAYNILKAAIDGLEYLPNYAQLDKMITRGDGYVADRDKYTDAGWDAFITALNTAKTVRANSEDQDEVDAATMSLYEAMMDLRLKPNKDLLNDLLNLGRSVNAKLYTVATMEALDKAIEAGDKVYKDTKATQAQVNKAAADIKKAYDALETVDTNDTDAGTKGNSGKADGSSGKQTANPKTGDASATGIILLIAAAFIGTQVFRKRNEK